MVSERLWKQQCSSGLIHFPNFTFVIDMLLDITLSSSDISLVDLPSGDPLVDASDIVLFGEDADEM